MWAVIDWRTAAAGVVAAFLSPAPTGDGRADLTGTWALVAWEKDGERYPVVLASHVVRLDVKDLTYRMDLAVALVGWSEHRGKFQIVGADKRVLKVDLAYISRGSVGESNRVAESLHTEAGIWELVGQDELRMCSTEGKDRPDKFETKKGDGRVLSLYKRKKP